MGKIKLCPRCNGKMVAISERTGGFSGKKAAAGALITGMPEVGLAAGALGKKLVTLRCEKCGYTIETDAKTAERAEWYGDVYGPAVELTTRMARESFENQRKLEILDKQLKEVLDKRLMPAKELSAGPILTEKERKAQRKQNSVISIISNAAAAVREDGTVMLAGNFYDDYRKEVKNWKNIVSVYLADEYNIYGLCKDGRVVYEGLSETIKNEVKKWVGITEIACNREWILGLKEDGTVVAVGNNIYGQCNVSEWKNITAINVNKNVSNLMGCSVGITSAGKLVTAGKTRMEKSEAIKNYGFDSVYGELTVDGYYGVSAFNGLFGEELFDSWEKLTDIRWYSGSGSDVFGLREDGAVYAATYINASLFKTLRKNLKKSDGIVAISMGYSSVTFLNKDGTVLRSCVDVEGKEKREKTVVDWEEIVAVEDGGDIILGVRADGTIAVACDEKTLYENKIPLYNDLKTWKDIRVIPEVKERVMRLAEETRKRKEEKDKIKEEKKKKKEEEQRKSWIAAGRCQYCGGKFSFFGKICKNCGKKKDY